MNNSPQTSQLNDNDVRTIVRDMVSDGSAGIESVVNKEITAKQFSVSMSSGKKDVKGIPLKDFPVQIRFYSGQASTIVRNLVLAGIAIVWIFKRPDAGKPVIQGLLNTELFLLALALFLDLLQYVWGTIFWRYFYSDQRKVAENKVITEPNYGDDIDTPGFISWPIDLLFYAKIIVLFFAYAGILKYVYAHF